MIRKYICDRCKQPFEGEEYQGVTCGFYDVHAKPWSDFANKGEQIVCDSCMHTDPRYVAVYGKLK